MNLLFGSGKKSILAVTLLMILGTELFSAHHVQQSFVAVNTEQGNLIKYILNTYIISKAKSNQSNNKSYRTYNYIDVLKQTILANHLLIDLRDGPAHRVQAPKKQNLAARLHKHQNAKNWFSPGKIH
jgi:hypothetical protein